MSDENEYLPDQPAEASNSEEVKIREIQRLAALSPIEYDQKRKVAAKAMGVRPATLDEAVKGNRREIAGSANGQGRPMSFEDPEPWAEPVAGGELLARLSQEFERHIVLPNGGADILALWVVYTYLADVWDYSPILHINAPEKQCGKSRVRDLCLHLVFRPVSSESATPAFLFRLIERDKPTLFLDEFDNADIEVRRKLLAILNSGYHRNGSVGLTVGEDHEPRTFSTFCPKMLVSVGNPLPDTTRSRSIVITLRRKLSSETVSSLRGFDGRELRRKCRRWADDNLPVLPSVRPDLPDWLDDRQKDVTEPLLAIADVLGGDWPNRAREALRQLMGGKVEPIANGTILLADTRAILEGADRVTSAELLTRLIRLEERPWPTYSRGCPLSAKNLASLLKPYGIESRTIKLANGSTARGYHRDQFEDAFRRYLPSQSSRQPVEYEEFCRHPDTKPANTGENPLFLHDTKKPGVGSEITTSASEYGAGVMVSGENGKTSWKGDKEHTPPGPEPAADDEGGWL